jgi:hypothetical protein
MTGDEAVDVTAGQPLGAIERHRKPSAESCPVVGIVEIAVHCGVQRATVDQWRQRGVLPEPPWIVGGRPAWPRGVLAELSARRG